jgi:hypothetical protein
MRKTEWSFLLYLCSDRGRPCCLVQFHSGLLQMNVGAERGVLRKTGQVSYRLICQHFPQSRGELRFGLGSVRLLGRRGETADAIVHYSRFTVLNEETTM